MKVDPRKLIMVGIEAKEGETIEGGFHLRWWTKWPNLDKIEIPEGGLPLSPPIEMGIPGTDVSSISDIPGFDIPGAGDTSFDGRAHLPVAFKIYRRKHYFHLDDNIELSTGFINDLLGSGSLALKDIDIEVEWKADISRLFRNRLIRTCISFLTGIIPFFQIVLLRFSQPKIKLRFPKLVHYLTTIASTNSMLGTPKIEIEYYSSENPEPLRNDVQELQGCLGSKSAAIKMDMGHCNRIIIYPNRLFDLKIKFSYMEDDLDFTGEHRWVEIAQTQFISEFFIWEAARNYCFPFPIKNRYLDFGPESLDYITKLNEKYGFAAFYELQRVFKILCRIRKEGERYWSFQYEQMYRTLNAEPETLLELFAIDPICATLLGIKFNDSQHNENPPQSGETYDYMVVTGWQEELGEDIFEYLSNRYGFITQKVNHQNSHPVSQPINTSARQKYGISWLGYTPLLLASVNWDTEGRGSIYNAIEPIVFDVWRGDAEDVGEWITLTYDPNKPEGRRVIDHPIVVSTEDDKSQFSAYQKGAGDLEYILRERTVNKAITSDQVNALQSLIENPSSFPKKERVDKFEEWVPLEDPQTHTSCAERTIYYRSRGIDHFGRFKPEGSNTAQLIMRRLDPPPEAVGVKAYLERNNNGIMDLYVSWYLGPLQERVGGEINHFNIMFQVFELAVSQKVREYEIVSPTPWPSDEEVESTNPSEEWRKMRNGWINGLLNINENNEHNPIPYKPMLPFTVTSVNDINGSRIGGKVLDCQPCSVTNLKTDSEGGLVETDYILEILPNEGLPIIIETDQCYLDIPPFVDLANRYMDSNHEVNIRLDEVLFEIEGGTYEVIGFEAGHTLRLTLIAPFDETQQQFTEYYLEEHGERLTPQFTLHFNSIKMDFTWDQQLQLSKFPDYEQLCLEYDDLENNPSLLQDSSSIRLSIQTADGILPEITGREKWLTHGAYLEYSYNEDDFRIPIQDFKVFEQFDQPIHDGPANKRVYLQEIVLSNITTEATEGQNPLPIFPEELLNELGGDQTFEIPFKIRMPLISRILTNLPATHVAAENLQSSKGGALSVIDDDEVFHVCEIITTPYVTSPDECFSFLIRASAEKPVSNTSIIGYQFLQPEANEDWNLHQSYFYVVDDIRQKMPNSNIRSVLTDLAISTHRKSRVDEEGAPMTSIPTIDVHGYLDEDLENLVSMPVQIRVSPDRPDAPLWVDPFSTRFTSFPRIIEGENVVYFEFCLEKITIDEGNEIISAIEWIDEEKVGQNPESVWEVLRASEDGLRALLQDQVIVGTRTVNIGSINYPGEYTEEEIKEAFNSLSFNDIRQMVSDSLINEWDDNNLTLKNVFKPVAKLTKGKNSEFICSNCNYRTLGISPEECATPNCSANFRAITFEDNETNRLKFIDKIEGVARGGIYYAVRKYIEGSPEGKSMVIGYRAEVVDTTPPKPPTITKTFYGDRSATVYWEENKELDLFSYEIYRAETQEETNNIQNMEIVKTLYLNPEVGEDPITPAPQVIKPMTQELVVRKLTSGPGMVRLYFPANILGINEIVGLFQLEDLPNEGELATFDYTSVQNFWKPSEPPQSSDIQLADRSIINIPVELSNKEKVGIVYLDASNDYKILHTIAYHSISIEGIEHKYGEINGIFPSTPLTVKDNKISLFFDSSIHGIASRDQIKGVYHKYAVPGYPVDNRDYDSENKFNHWEKIWPNGDDNNEADFDGRFLVGINLPNGTEVVIEYDDKKIEQMIPSEDLNSLEATFLGFLPGNLNGNPVNDPAEISHELDDNGDRTRNLRFILKDQITRNYLKTPIAVRLRYQGIENGFPTNKLDSKTSELFYTDHCLECVGRPLYKVFAVRKIQYAKNPDRFKLQRSLTK